MMFWMRRVVNGERFEWVMAMSNSCRNWRNDVWYMQLTLLIVTIRKYSTEPRVATATAHDSDSYGISYPNLLFVANLNSLKDRRDELSRSFFQKMSNPASCLHHLVPPRRNTSRLRSCTPLPRPTSRTKKFQSFMNFALSKYQSPI